MNSKSGLGFASATIPENWRKSGWRESNPSPLVWKTNILAVIRQPHIFKREGNLSLAPSYLGDYQSYFSHSNRCLPSKLFSYSLRISESLQFSLFHYNNYIKNFYYFQGTKKRLTGFEPVPSRWQREILTIIL